MPDKPIGWAAWHPLHSFEVPQQHDGPIAYANLSVRLATEIRTLNGDDGTTNRTGWRAVKVALVKVPA
jgi:hypothetical protein